MRCLIKNISINYEIIGDGIPVLMLHGYYVDHRMMVQCMEKIFKDNPNYKRIYMDLPGMGKSTINECVNSSDAMLDIVMEFINIVIKEENFLVVGESYGGYLSQGLIYKMRDRIDGALLICPVVVANNKKRKVPEHVVLSKDPNLHSYDYEKNIRQFKDMAVVESKRNYDRYKNEILSAVYAASHDFLKNLKSKEYEFSFDLYKDNKKFDKPSLVLLGKQDSCVGYKDFLNVYDNFTRATVSILDKSGHNLQIEQENLFNSLVKEWLERVN